LPGVGTSVPPADAAEKALTAGKPKMYHRVRVVDGLGRDVPAGEPGEVWISGPCVTQGYWENPAATRAAFRDGWLCSGDVGYVDGQGYLHIADRIKDIIIVGASNVYPSDLEAVFAGCPEIKEAAIVGRPDEELGQVPVACVVAAEGSSLTATRVLELFENRLAAYKHPRDVVFLEALPRNAMGKVHREALRDLARSGTRPEAS
jgi:fatty-acyl-CoA synthase